jgi:uncharacterized protein
MKETTISSIRPINSMANVGGFLSAWRNGKVSPPETICMGVTISMAGNINLGGILGGTYCPAFTRTHPSFSEILEPRVRPIVLALTECWGFVTYTSCEGHIYGRNENEETGTELHVGILPRSPSEVDYARNCVRSIVDQYEASLSSRTAFPCLASGTLFDEATGNSWPVIDLYLRKVTKAKWRDYIDGLSIDATSLANIIPIQHAKHGK